MIAFGGRERIQLLLYNKIRSTSLFFSHSMFVTPSSLSSPHCQAVIIRKHEASQGGLGADFDQQIALAQMRFKIEGMKVHVHLSRPPLSGRTENPYYFFCRYYRCHRYPRRCQLRRYQPCQHLCLDIPGLRFYLLRPASLSQGPCDARHDCNRSNRSMTCT